jgi:hypothetical protein
MSDPDLEQLHVDAIAALERKMLHDLDFTPTCDFHRIYQHIEKPAPFAFTCRRCGIVELRCEHCTAWWQLHLHAQVECQKCPNAGCFHDVVRVTGLGGAA